MDLKTKLKKNQFTNECEHYKTKERTKPTCAENLTNLSRQGTEKRRKQNEKIEFPFLC